VLKEIKNDKITITEFKGRTFVQMIKPEEMD